MALDNAGPAWIFCPADRPERFEKAAAAADTVILDLEDGAGDKPKARSAIVDTPLDPARTVIRINAADSGEQEADLAALARTAYTTVMLPKCEAAEQVTALAPLDVVLIVETPLGALKVDETAAAANTVLDTAFISRTSAGSTTGAAAAEGRVKRVAMASVFRRSS